MKNGHSQTAKVTAPEQRHYAANDLFPDSLPPVISASWPAPGTRAAEALGALLQGPVNQLEYRNGWRLAAYVQSLRYDGWGIISRPIVKPGCRAEIAEYRLDLAHPGTAAALAARGLA